MNPKDCLLAFADMDKAYVSAANDIDSIRRSFTQQKKRRTQMIGAVCGCIAVIFAVAAFGSGHWFRQMPAVIPSETEIGDHTMTGSPSSEAPSTVSGFIPPETEAPSSTVQVTETEQNPQTSSVAGEAQNQPTQSTEPYSVTSPAVEATTETPEAAFYEAYCYSLDDPAYSAYIPGKVITPDRVGEKIGDATVTAGWKYADGTMPVTEQLRCEIYRITDIDPATAICIKFLDKGEALTTDHYYVQINASADLSAVADYIIPAQVSNGEE